MKTIGVCLKAENNPFWSIDVRKGLEEAIREYPDVTLRYKTPERIIEIKKQIEILEEFIKNGVHAIILAPSDPIKLAPICRKVNKANIPLIIIDSDLAENYRKKINYSFLGFDDFQGGFETGEYLKSRLTKGSEVAIIHGYKTGTYLRRVEGFLKSVEGHLFAKEKISANFEEAKSYSAAKKIVKKNQRIKAIFCTSDNMALGAITALHELNRTDVLVSGFDFTYAGRLAIQKGRMASTVDTHSEELGKKAIFLAMQLIARKKTSSRQVSKVDFITKENYTSLPKQVFQKRKYLILDALKDCSEYEYEELHEHAVCPIIIAKEGYLEELPPRLKRLSADKYVIITDSKVENLYGTALLDGLHQMNMVGTIQSFAAGETQKTFSTLNYLVNRILDKGITKKSCIVVLGGGVVGNLAGFIAAILLRGIRFVHVPTTVTAQIDSTTGGKQAVNTTHGKNLLGTFYEPEFIYIDKEFIRTLPKREYSAGIAESIKHGLCQSPSLLDAIERGEYRNILLKTLKAKISVMEKDPREKNDGLVLLYGHTVGHTLETLSSHKLNHGEAISIGMVVAARISFLLEFSSQKLIEFHCKILMAQGLPTRIPANISTKSIMSKLFYDKKERGHEMSFVLLENVGKTKRVGLSCSIPVSAEIIKKALEESR